MSSAAGNVFLPSELDASNIGVRALKSLSNGGKIASITYNGSQGRIQAPAMMCPQGIDTGPDDDVRKQSFHLSFKGEEVSEEMETLHNFFRDLDERMIDLAVENSTEWFKKKLSRAVIQEFYTPILKVSRDRDTGEPDGKWPDTIKIKVPQNQETGAFRTEFQNPAQELIDEPNLDDLIRKGSSINAIINPAFVWIVGSKFGLTINASQVWVTSMPQQMRGFAFRTEGSAGAPIPGASMPSAASGGGASRKFQLQDDDDDDEVANKYEEDEDAGEEEDEDEESAPPSPPPAKKAPVRRRRKVAA